MPKLIIGLGNPGSQYARTRHNVGFLVADAFAERHGLTVETKARKALVGEGRWRGGDRLVVIKPQTYMNLSGEAVVAALNWYKATPADLIVVHDDMDLAVGRLRLRTAGSSGGQNGIRNIIDRLGSEEFARIRVGIGRPLAGWDAVNWVLTPFTPDEQPLMADAVMRAADALDVALNQGFIKAMNQFNRNPSTPDPGSEPPAPANTQ